MKKFIAYTALLCTILTINSMEQIKMYASCYLDMLLSTALINTMVQADRPLCLEAPIELELAQCLVDAKANRDKVLPSELFGTVSKELAKVKPAKIAACLKELKKFSGNEQLLDTVATYFVEQAILCKQDKSTFDKWFKEKDDQEVLKALKQKFDHQKKYQLAEIFNKDTDLLIPGELLRSIIFSYCLPDKVKRTVLYTLDSKNSEYVDLSFEYPPLRRYGWYDSLPPEYLKAEVALNSSYGLTLDGQELDCICTLDNLTVTSSGKIAKVWDQNGICIATLEGHTEDISSVKLAGNNIITGSYDKTAKMWSLDGVCIVTIDTGREIDELAIMSDGYIVTKAEKTVEVWGLKGVWIAMLQDHLNDEESRIYERNSRLASTSEGYLFTGLACAYGKKFNLRKWLKDITQEVNALSNNIDLEQLIFFNYLNQLIQAGVKTALESKKFTSESIKKVMDILPPLIRKNIELQIKFTERKNVSGRCVIL